METRIRKRRPRREGMVQFNVWLSPELKAAYLARAEREDLDGNKVARRLFREYVESPTQAAA